MGSQGEKRTRKGKKRTHLAKVGAHDAARAEQHREREAIADTTVYGTRVTVLVPLVVMLTSFGAPR